MAVTKETGGKAYTNKKARNALKKATARATVMMKRPAIAAAIRHKVATSTGQMREDRDRWAALAVDKKRTAMVQTKAASAARAEVEKLKKDVEKYRSKAETWQKKYNDQRVEAVETISGEQKEWKNELEKARSETARYRKIAGEYQMEWTKLRDQYGADRIAGLRATVKGKGRGRGWGPHEWQ